MEGVRVRVLQRGRSRSSGLSAQVLGVVGGGRGLLLLYHRERMLRAVVLAEATERHPWAVRGKAKKRNETRAKKKKKETKKATCSPPPSLCSIPPLLLGLRIEMRARADSGFGCGRGRNRYWREGPAPRTEKTPDQCADREMGKAQGCASESCPVC